MSKKTKTTAAIAAAAAIGATCVGLAVGGNAAGADPITSGQTTIGVPSDSILNGVVAGVTAYAEAPASQTNDTANMAIDYTFPVTGGNGSLKNGFGRVDSSGGVLITDAATGKSVELDDFQFSTGTERLKATPAGSTHPLNFARVRGTQVITYDPNTNNQDLHASRLTLNPAGAAFLNQALDSTAFRGGQFIGTFETSFVYTPPAS